MVTLLLCETDTGMCHCWLWSNLHGCLAQSQPVAPSIQLLLSVALTGATPSQMHVTLAAACTETQVNLAHLERCALCETALLFMWSCSFLSDAMTITQGEKLHAKPCSFRRDVLDPTESALVSSSRLEQCILSGNLQAKPGISHIFFSLGAGCVFGSNLSLLVKCRNFIIRLNLYSLITLRKMGVSRSRLVDQYQRCCGLWTIPWRIRTPKNSHISSFEVGSQLRVRDKRRCGVLVNVCSA